MSLDPSQTFERAVPVAVPLPESAPSSAGSPRGPAGVNGGRQAEKQGKANEPPRERDPFVTIVLEYSPPWLVSMVFHMLALIIMGLVIFSQTSPAPVRLEAEAASPDQLDQPLESDAQVGLPDGLPEGQGEVLTPPGLEPVDNPLASPGIVPIRPGGHAATSNIAAPGIAWSNRGTEWGGSKEAARKGNGGTDLTQLAVARGLEWLARNQQRDGSWSLTGPYSDGVLGDENQAAATAMALLAFQGDGNTHVDGKYKRNVARAWNWLLKQQDNTGCFFHFGNYTHRFYTQGMCSIALCELYGMTRDSRISSAGPSGHQLLPADAKPQGGLALQSERRQRCFGDRLDRDGSAKCADGRPESACGKPLQGREIPRQRRQPERARLSLSARRTWRVCGPR